MAVGSTTPKMSLLTIGRLSILPMPAAGVSRHRSTTVISEIPRRSRLGPLLSGAAECTPNANHMGRAGVSCQALPTARVPHLATLRVPLGGRGNDSEPLSGKRSKNAARRRPHWGRGIFWTGPLREAWLARVSCPGQQGARLLRGGGRSTEPRGSWPLSPPAARPPPLRSFRQGTRACVCERASRSSTDERRAGPARARCGDQEWREHCKRGNLPFGSGRRGGGGRTWRTFQSTNPDGTLPHASAPQCRRRSSYIHISGVSRRPNHASCSRVLYATVRLSRTSRCPCATRVYVVASGRPLLVTRECEVGRGGRGNRVT